MDGVRDDLRYKNEKLDQSCRTIFNLEQQIIQYARMYKQSKVEIDIKKDEIHFLSYPKDPEVISMDERLARYIERQENAVKSKYRHRPTYEEILIKNQQPDLTRPLAFYNSFVSLNALQQEKVGEEILVTYYKGMIEDLILANESLKAEIEEIKLQLHEDTAEKRRLLEERERMK